MNRMSQEIVLFRCLLNVFSLLTCTCTSSNCPDRTSSITGADGEEDDIFSCHSVVCRDFLMIFL